MDLEQLNDLHEKVSDKDTYLRIIKADNTGNSFTLLLKVETRKDMYQGGTEYENWQIEVEGHRKSYISFDAAPAIELKHDHPLLWEFNDSLSELYYTRNRMDAYQLFYELYNAHEESVGKHLPFDVSLAPEIEKDISFSNGLLARGPKKLMTAYADCLRANSVEATIVDEKLAKAWGWDDRHVLRETQSLKILLMGETYVVGNGFSFFRLYD